MKFLVPDFSFGETKGAVHPVIDTKGRTVRKIRTSENTSEIPGYSVYYKGPLDMNGWNKLLLVKCNKNVDIKLKITGRRTEDYPLQKEYIAPLITKFGKVDIPIYKIEYNGTFYRKVYDNFKGVNSITRGIHCFETTGNIISSPPYNTSSNLLGASPGDRVTVTSTFSQYTTSLFSGWNGIYFQFEKLISAIPVDSFVVFSNEDNLALYELLNLSTGRAVNFFLTVEVNINLNEPVPENPPGPSVCIPTHFLLLHRELANAATRLVRLRRYREFLLSWIQKEQKFNSRGSIPSTITITRHSTTTSEVVR